MGFEVDRLTSSMVATSFSGEPWRSSWREIHWIFWRSVRRAKAALNCTKMEYRTHLGKKAFSRSFIRRRCKLFRTVPNLGIRRHHSTKLQQGCYGLSLPNSDHLIKKGNPVATTHLNDLSREHRSRAPRYADARTAKAVASVSLELDPQWLDECLAAEEKQDDLTPMLGRAHRNLGHPPIEDLLRALRNANASDRAMEAARKFEMLFL